MKTIKINFLVFCFLVLFVEIFFISFNYIFDGVAIYKQLNISNVQGISHAQKKYKKQKRKTLNPFWTREIASFSTLGSGGKVLSKIIPIFIINFSFHVSFDRKTIQSEQSAVIRRQVKKSPYLFESHSVQIERLFHELQQGFPYHATHNLP